jgi:hypothetical protein
MGNTVIVENPLRDCVCMLPEYLAIDLDVAGVISPKKW